MGKKEEIIHLELEKSRIEREKARIILNMGLVIYFGFLIAGIIGFAFEFITSSFLNVIVICGIFVLIISTAPYLIIVHKEERWIKKKERELR
jgi:uncharacterized oligopeptide transporter (OPT) family protein